MTSAANTVKQHFSPSFQLSVRSPFLLSHNAFCYFFRSLLVRLGLLISHTHLFSFSISPLQHFFTHACHSLSCRGDHRLSSMIFKPVSHFDLALVMRTPAHPTSCLPSSRDSQTGDTCKEKTAYLKQDTEPGHFMLTVLVTNTNHGIITVAVIDDT